MYTATIYPNEEDLPSIDGEEAAGINFKSDSDEMETDAFLIFWPLQTLFELLCGLVPVDPVCGYDVVRGNRYFTNQCQMRTVNWFTGRSKYFCYLYLLNTYDCTRVRQHATKYLYILCFSRLYYTIQLIAYI